MGSNLQLTPALTDFKGPTIFICYRRISIIANIENKEKLFKGLKSGFRYRRISITGGSVRVGFNCILLSPLTTSIHGLPVDFVRPHLISRFYLNDKMQILSNLSNSNLLVSPCIRPHRSKGAGNFFFFTANVIGT